MRSFKSTGLSPFLIRIHREMYPTLVSSIFYLRNVGAAGKMFRGSSYYCSTRRSRLGPAPPKWLISHTNSSSRPYPSDGRVSHFLPSKAIFSDRLYNDTFTDTRGSSNQVTHHIHKNLPAYIKKKYQAHLVLMTMFSHDGSNFASVLFTGDHS